MKNEEITKLRQAKYPISSFMEYLKSKSTLMIFKRHANLKYQFWNRNFWGKRVFCRYSRKKWKSNEGVYSKSVTRRPLIWSIKFERIYRPVYGWAGERYIKRASFRGNNKPL